MPSGNLGKMFRFSAVWKPSRIAGPLASWPGMKEAVKFGPNAVEYLADKSTET